MTKVTMSPKDDAIGQAILSNYGKRSEKGSKKIKGWCLKLTWINIESTAVNDQKTHENAKYKAG